MYGGGLSPYNPYVPIPAYGVPNSYSLPPSRRNLFGSSLTDSHMKDPLLSGIGGFGGIAPEDGISVDVSVIGDGFGGMPGMGSGMGQMPGIGGGMGQMPGMGGMPGMEGGMGQMPGGTGMGGYGGISQVNSMSGGLYPGRINQSNSISLRRKPKSNKRILLPKHRNLE